MTKYPPDILRLLHFEGFNEAFEEELPKHETQEQAYFSVEDCHIAHFGKPRYSEFLSFRSNRYHYLAKRKKDASK